MRFGIRWDLPDCSECGYGIIQASMLYKCSVCGKPLCIRCVNRNRIPLCEDCTAECRETINLSLFESIIACKECHDEQGDYCGYCGRKVESRVRPEDEND